MDTILQELNQLIERVDTHESKDEKATRLNDNDESLVISQEEGRYCYNRFGYADWRKIAYKMMQKYNVQFDTGDDKSQMSKNKKKHRKPWPQCVVTASGMNAISAVLNGILIRHSEERINILYSNELYDDTPKLIAYLQQCSRANINLMRIANVCNSKELQCVFSGTAVQTGDVNVLFIESCSNPNGYVMDFNLIATLKENTKRNAHCYAIVDNTWLTSAIFNPFEHGADFVVTSLSKYYSGGHCIAGAVLYREQTVANVELMKAITDWVRVNGIHVSPYHCKLIDQNLDLMQQRIDHTSNVTTKLAQFLSKQYGYIVEVSHNSLSTHVSFAMYQKYIHRALYPSVISFKLNTTKMNQVRKWLSSSAVLLAKTSFGGKHSRFDTYPYRDDKDGLIVCRFAVGYEDALHNLQKELQIMIPKLRVFCQT